MNTKKRITNAIGIFNMFYKLAGQPKQSLTTLANTIKDEHSMWANATSIKWRLSRMNTGNEICPLEWSETIAETLYCPVDYLTGTQSEPYLVADQIGEAITKNLVKQIETLRDGR